jgi:prepilin-type N-terminal cleavage/methylation domain-containing protein
MKKIKTPLTRGYSLVEVLIAMAITSIVLLTVVTLFYMGQRNVYSGKQMTYAVSVGTRVLEDLSAMSAQDLLTNFNISDSTTLASVQVPGVGGVTSGGVTNMYEFTNSIGRDTTGCTANGSPPPAFTCTNDVTPFYLSQWRALIDESKLANARVGLVITPRNIPNPAPATCENPPCPITSARFFKIRAYVSWEEAANRRRIAFFDTTKVNRD